jgi:hypothetical protein
VVQREEVSNNFDRDKSDHQELWNNIVLALILDHSACIQEICAVTLRYAEIISFKVYNDI